MEEDRFEVIDQDAYEAVNAKERTRITSFDDASFYYVDGSLTEAVIAGKKDRFGNWHRNSPSEEVLHWNVQLHFPQRD